MKHNFKPWQPVVVRMKDGGRWEADFFCRYLEGNEMPYRGISGYDWRHCLPAEGNEGLVGTAGSPDLPEPESKHTKDDEHVGMKVDLDLPESELAFGDKVKVSADGTTWWDGIYIDECRADMFPARVLARIPKGSGYKCIVVNIRYCHKKDW